MSYSEGGSKTAIVMVLWPNIAYNNFLMVSEIHHDHRTVCLLLWPTFTDQPIQMTWNQREMALIHETRLPQALNLPLSLLPLFFQSTHKIQLPNKLQLPNNLQIKVWFIMLYMHVIPKFIRSMLHVCDLQWPYRIANIVQSVEGFRPHWSELMHLRFWENIAKMIH